MISIFGNIKQSKDGDKISVEEFINQVKFGKWKNLFDEISSIKDKKERQKRKSEILPYVTISGLFNHRKKDDLVKHSGFICLDFDDVDNIDSKIEEIKKDLFTYCVFRSVSGLGFSVIVKIDGRRHLDAFLGLEVYFAKKYKLHLDKSCKDVTRARFVSYDENLYVNVDSQKFANYIPKSDKIAKSKLPNVITGDNDIDYIIDQINQEKLDITNSSYLTYMEIGFALSEEYGEGGRSYFHALCYYYSDYNSKECDKQYDKCLKNRGSGITIATFLYHCKNAGLSIVSPETKKIVTVSAMQKNSGGSVKSVVDLLSEVDGIAKEVSEPIIKKVFKREDLSDDNKLSKLESIEIFLNSNYNIKLNEVTNYYQDGDEEISSRFLNSIYLKARKEVDDKIKYDEIERLIFSDFIESYNPLQEFFERNAHMTPTGAIDRMIGSVKSKDSYKDKLFKKWMVGIVASIYGEHSPLLYVLCGGVNAGKTEFFRRMMPEELKPYYAESKLDREKDDELLMCQKFLILDDEFGGKSKLEAKRLKELTSKEYFTLREPYGRRNMRYKRLAVLCGTSNDPLILNDPTGNRRIIPVWVDSMDFEAYNEVDKTEVFMEAYHLYKSGFNFRMTKEDIADLNENTAAFEQISPEKELLMRFFKKAELSDGSDNGIESLQAIEIKDYIENETKQKISILKLTAEIKSIGYSVNLVRANGVTKRVYMVCKIPTEIQLEEQRRNPYARTGF